MLKRFIDIFRARAPEAKPAQPPVLVVTREQMAAQMNMSTKTLARLIEQRGLPSYDYDSGRKKGWYIKTMDKFFEQRAGDIVRVQDAGRREKLDNAREARVALPVAQKKRVRSGVDARAMAKIGHLSV